MSWSVTMPIGVASDREMTASRLADLSIILETASRIVASG